MRAAYGPSGPPPDRSSPVSAWPGPSPLVTETTSSALLAGHATVITLRTPTMPHRGDYVNTPGQGPKTDGRNFQQLSSRDPSCPTESLTPQRFRSQGLGIEARLWPTSRARSRRRAAGPSGLDAVVRMGESGPATNRSRAPGAVRGRPRTASREARRLPDSPISQKNRPVPSMYQQACSCRPIGSSTAPPGAAAPARDVPGRSSVMIVVAFQQIRLKSHRDHGTGAAWRGRRRGPGRLSATGVKIR